MTAPTTTGLAAMQTTLAAEHAAVHVYGVLGAQTSRTATPALFAAVSSAYTEHRSRRDLLVRAIAGEGGMPVASAASYELPLALGTVAGVTRAALELERGCATTYAWLVANTVGPHRRWAVGALTDAAVRGLGFGGVPEPLPGE